MTAYYNENHPPTAAWLRELIRNGLIAPGDVDDRSIVEVSPDDVAGYTQCHFFAGIGGWSYALRLAQWPDDVPVWTASLPCQPFSISGNKKGFDDERHLWPVYYDLVRQCRPATMFGEQVASPHGRAWIDVVQADMEASGYAFGKVALSAACVGAPHIRERMFWVADAVSERWNPWGKVDHGWNDGAESDTDGRARWLGNSDGAGSQRRQERSGAGSDKCFTGQADTTGGLADPRDRQLPVAGRGPQGGDGERQNSQNAYRGPWRASTDDSVWRDPDWVFCQDSKWRPVEPGAQPLADGIPARVGRLRGYGNAIVPQLAAEVIRAYMECQSPLKPGVNK